METLLNKLNFKNHLNGKEAELSNPSNVTTVKSFSDYGHGKAGKNGGDATAFKIFLSWIKDGYVVDENYNEKEATEKRKEIEGQIEDKKDEKEKVNSEKRDVEDVQIPDNKRKRAGLENDIAQVHTDLDSEMFDTGYQSTNYYMYVGLTLLLSVYLLFFYASVIYSAFFRSAGLLIENSGDDLAMVIGSIFDMRGILSPSPNLIIIYLGAVLFFALGIIPHTFKGKFKSLKIALFLLLTLAVDALLAYKIDHSIHEIKVLSGIAEENWKFWASENFYLVLAFGYLAYLVFGYVYQLMIEEKIKKNPKKIALRKIQHLKDQIQKINLTINQFETKIVALESQVKILENKIELLTKRLNEPLINPDVLSKSLNSFYIGWIQFLNGSSDYKQEKLECESAYRTFMEENFKSIPSIN